MKKHVGLLLLFVILILSCSFLPACRLGISDPGAVDKSQSLCGINLAGVNDWTAELPFRDMVKIARPWNNGDFTGLTFDENGWVTSIAAGTVTARLGWDNPVSFAGQDFVCLYEGTGTINVNQYIGMIETARAPGRIEYTMADDSIGLGAIEIPETDPGNTGDYIRNIRVIRAEDESDYLTDPWNPDFIEKIVDNFSTLRFMDWQSTNNSITTGWDEVKTMDYYTQSDCTAERSTAVAPGYMADLCNSTDSDGWFCIPHLADDDYILRFATFLRDNMDPDLKIYIEYSNECWNWMFDQCSYCHEQGQLLNLDPDEWTAWRDFYALRSVEMFHIFESVFSGQTDRLVRVLASQGAWYDISNRMLNYEIDGQRAARHADAFAIAPYFGTAAHTIDSPTSASLFGWLDTDVNDPAWPDESDTVFTQMIRNYEMFIVPNPDLRLIAYEGGQHILPLSETAPDVWEYDEDKDELFYSAQLDPQMGALYSDYLTHWRDAGGELFMLFSSVGNWGRYGYWGLVPDLDSISPKYEAVLDWIIDNPVWW